MALLAATVLVNLISAYIRLTEAGTGCSPWPDCYAQVERYLSEAPPSASATLAPVQKIKQAHRATATVLVLIVLAIVALARGLPLGSSVQTLPYAITFVVLLLAVVGPASYLKALPAVATANLAGGMALLALSWLLRLGISADRSPALPKLRVATRVALGVLIVQILLGAWVSANFAAAACSGFLSCGVTGSGLESFWYFRELSVDGAGRIVQDGSQALIQSAHHGWAVVTTLSLAWLGWRGASLGGRARLPAITLLILLACQLALGLGGIATSLPVWIVLAHNLVASLLLLTVLSLLALSREAPAALPRTASAGR